MAENKKKDFDVAPATVEDQHEQMRLFMESYNRNEVKIAGTVRSKYLGEPKPKVDKETKQQILIDGIPQFWEPFRSVSITFDGGELDIKLTKEQFEQVQEGVRYLFVGTKGLNYGQVTDKFHSITQI